MRSWAVNAAVRFVRQASGMTRVITCILNGTAGTSAAAEMRQQLAGLFEERGTPVTILVAEHGDQIPQLTSRAIQEGATIVVAVGGDGTGNCVANIVLKNDGVLGVLPGGTLNHFAKDLGIPCDLAAAVDALLAGQTARVDVGEVNGKIFLNNSSLGLYPAVVRQREEFQKKGHAKWSAFAAAATFAMLRYRHLYVRLEGDGMSEVEETTPFVFIGNNEYQLSGMRLGKRDRLDTGELWIYRAPRASRLSLMAMTVRALCGVQDRRELAVVRAKALRIRTRRHRIHVARDGEVDTMEGPLHYRIRPKALSVIVPKPLPQNPNREIV